MYQVTIVPFCTAILAVVALGKAAHWKKTMLVLIPFKDVCRPDRRPEDNLNHFGRYWKQT